MSQLCQLVYASRARLDSNGARGVVSPEVARILTQSRRNNKPLQVGGVLCFGDDCFFQCLEGERDVVERLYERIEKDPRHRDVMLLRKETVHHRQYRLWAMKYFSVEKSIRAFLDAKGLDGFDPFELDDRGIDGLLEILREEMETRINQPAGNRPQELQGMGAAGGVSPAMLGVGALAAAVAVVAMIVLVIL